jgi:hypothetical protein
MDNSLLFKRLYLLTIGVFSAVYITLSISFRNLKKGCTGGGYELFNNSFTKGIYK